MIRVFQFVLLVYSFFVASFAYANAQDELQAVQTAMQQAYEAGSLNEAYNIATTHAFELEGYPLFDLYYGLITLGLQKYAEAQFAFERLVAQYPDQGRLRLEYARTLFHLQHYQQASEQLRYVLDSDPPEGVQENINTFLDTIQKRQRAHFAQWSGLLDVGGGVDSNINSATDLETVSNILLSDSSRSTESSFWSARTGLNYKYPFNQKHALNIGFDSQHKYNEEINDYDYDILQLEASWKISGVNRQFEWGLSYLHMLLDGAAYQSVTGAFGRWRQQWHSNFLTQLSIGYVDKVYDTSVELDSTQPSLNLTFLMPIHQATHSFVIFYQSDQADDNDFDERMRDYAGLAYQYGRTISRSLSFFVGAAYNVSRYQDENSLFLETRSDDSAQVLVGGKWNMSEHLSLHLESTYLDSKSNIEIYEYDRNRSELKIRWEF